MSQTSRYTKLGHLVCDGSGGHLVRGTGDHLVYVDTTSCTFTQNPSGDEDYYRTGSDATFATALSNMQSASWIRSYPGDGAGTASVFWPGSYTLAQVCVGWLIESPSSRYISKMTFSISALTNSPTWRVGWRTGVSVPQTAWSWTDDAPSVTGTGTGAQEITIGATCTDFLWLILTLYPYPDTTKYTAAGVSWTPATMTV